MVRLSEIATKVSASLACVLPVTAIAQTGSPETFGSWLFTTERDVMSDASSSSIVVRSGGNEFAFQCDAPGQGSVYPIFVADSFLGGRGSGYDRRSITLRFDSMEAEDTVWIYKDTTAFITQDPGQTLSIMKRAKTAERLAIRAVTYDGRFAEAVFNIEGILPALQKIRAACMDAVDSL